MCDLYKEQAQNIMVGAVAVILFSSQVIMVNDLIDKNQQSISHGHGVMNSLHRVSPKDINYIIDICWKRHVKNNDLNESTFEQLFLTCSRIIELSTSRYSVYICARNKLHPERL